MLPIQIMHKQRVRAFANTTRKKVGITNWEDTTESDGNYILSIGDVSQPDVESSNGSKISFN